MKGEQRIFAQKNVAFVCHRISKLCVSAVTTDAVSLLKTAVEIALLMSELILFCINTFFVCIIDADAVKPVICPVKLNG